MNKAKQSIDQTSYMDRLLQICRIAVRKAQAESRAMGVANVYSINGQLYYELPNGEITRTQPEGFKQTRP